MVVQNEFHKKIHISKMISFLHIQCQCKEIGIVRSKNKGKKENPFQATVCKKKLSISTFQEGIEMVITLPFQQNIPLYFYSSYVKSIWQCNVQQDGLPPLGTKRQYFDFEIKIFWKKFPRFITYFAGNTLLLQHQLLI